MSSVMLELLPLSFSLFFFIKPQPQYVETVTGIHLRESLFGNVGLPQQFVFCPKSSSAAKRSQVFMLFEEKSGLIARSATVTSWVGTILGISFGHEVAIVGVTSGVSVAAQLTSVPEPATSGLQLADFTTSSDALATPAAHATCCQIYRCFTTALDVKELTTKPLTPIDVFLWAVISHSFLVSSCPTAAALEVILTLVIAFGVPTFKVKVAERFTVLGSVLLVVAPYVAVVPRGVVPVIAGITAVRFLKLPSDNT
ncbi:hypothetical protein K435DRAFT_794058 [Dendrothele bispora CBS 962.96]|uniref:Uncharacterized protein n=1 Tax=Dendrothele bispora (strain CBS 962.96) TaxID=1314807 RepID=A0A4S8MDU4_DENBC|nr:hypothetical protein K435DRAFT_794058 [Dendrothele bispora CBS 962.96]